MHAEILQPQRWLCFTENCTETTVTVPLREGMVHRSPCFAPPKEAPNVSRIPCLAPVCSTDPGPWFRIPIEIAYCCRLRLSGLGSTPGPVPGRKAWSNGLPLQVCMQELPRVRALGKTTWTGTGQTRPESLPYLTERLFPPRRRLGVQDCSCPSCLQPLHLDRRAQFLTIPLPDLGSAS